MGILDVNLKRKLISQARLAFFKASKMTATAHALVGAAIATKVVNPILGFPLALISHFMMDAIPHWDAGTNWRSKTKLRLYIESAIDVLVGFGLVFLLFRNLVNPTYLWSMVIMAQLPDWLEAPAWYLDLKVPPFSWVQSMQDAIHHKLGLPWGLAVQGIMAIVVLFWALSLTPFGPILAQVF